MFSRDEVHDHQVIYLTTNFLKVLFSMIFNVCIKSVYIIVYIIMYDEITVTVLYQSTLLNCIFNLIMHQAVISLPVMTKFQQLLSCH